MKKFTSLIPFLLIVFAISFISSQVTMPAVETWYQEIKKPSWTPPNWVFAPVWTTLYIMIAVSGWMVWNKLPTQNFTKKLTSLIIAPYWLQLALNFLWSLVFFGQHQFIPALIIIVCLLTAIGLNIGSFLKISKPAAWLLVPYFIWVAYATSLNAGIAALNQ